MPILWALADAKLGEREVVEAMLDREPQLLADRPGLPLITDKGFASKRFETDLAERGGHAAAPGTQEGTAPGRADTAQGGPAADRVGQRHTQRPARSGNARRAYLRRHRCPGRATSAGHDGRNLAQPQDGTTGDSQPDRL
ncbi:hypothetical protein ABT369_47645 [Dactylosporangium sp. NPDC000244]|uniref:hypothetical protein n=1 Tax=Dactylosporangium sp. NPDC000244 TaxID=3154365 RepID=UPI003319251E